MRLNPLHPAQPPWGRGLTYGQGWHPRTEAGVRWAYADAVVSYFNPLPGPVPVRLEFELMGVTPRVLILEQNGREVHRWRLGTEPVQCAPPGLLLSPGVNCFKFRSLEPARRLGAGRYQLRSFGLREGAVRVGEHGVAAGERVEAATAQRQGLVSTGGDGGRGRGGMPKSSAQRASSICIPSATPRVASAGGEERRRAR